MKKVLLVVDMQNDFLYENRKKFFCYDAEKLVRKVNYLIAEFPPSDVVYVRHIVRNTRLNKALFGYCLRGTEGAELYRRLDVVSSNCFDKSVGNAFLARQIIDFTKENAFFTADLNAGGEIPDKNSKLLGDFINEKGFASVTLCGLDECGCIAATANGAYKNGVYVEIATQAVATIMPQKSEKIRETLKAKGIIYSPPNP